MKSGVWPMLSRVDGSRAFVSVIREDGMFLELAFRGNAKCD